MSADVSRDASAQVWRVECEGGEVREVDVVAEGAWWTARRPGDSDDESAASSASARCAVAKVAARWHWPLVAILAPSEETRAEATARARREGAEAMREACAERAEAAAARHRTREGDISHDARVARYTAGVLRDVDAAIRTLPLPE